MANRNHMLAVENKLQPERIQTLDFLKMAVFEYLIGNTDWSVSIFTKLIASDSLSLPNAVPYDFDHAGIVSAPYPKPAEARQLISVRERRY